MIFISPNRRTKLKDDGRKLVTYPKDCSTALIKQVLPRFLNPTKFLRASFFLIAELLLLFGPVDDLKLFLLLFPFPLVPSLLFRDFLIAGWFSTPLKTKQKQFKKLVKTNEMLHVKSLFTRFFFVSATLRVTRSRSHLINNFLKFSVKTLFVTSNIRSLKNIS